VWFFQRVKEKHRWKNKVILWKTWLL